MQPLVTNTDNIHYTVYIFLFFKPVNIEYAFFVLSFCWKNAVVKYFNKFFNSFLAKVTFLLLDVTQNFKNYIKILHCAVLKRKLKIRKKNEKRKSKVKVSFTYEGGVGGFWSLLHLQKMHYWVSPLFPLTMQLIGSYMKENLYHCEIM